MELHIFPLEKAFLYKPQHRTYAIRIGSPRDIETYEQYRLVSPLYRFIGLYIFDDIEPWMKRDGGLLFNGKIAKTILTDFQENSPGCESLLVHCIGGQNRSPAVAMALNDIFRLGKDSSDLEARFPEFNSFVYWTLRKTAEKAGLLR